MNSIALTFILSIDEMICLLAEMEKPVFWMFVFMLFIAFYANANTCSIE